MADIVRNDKRTVFGWAMYDWANSAYATTSGAIVAPFFTSLIVPEEGYWGMSAGAIWSFLVSGGAFVLFLLMPVLGAVADFAASKRAFLRAFAVLGALFTMGIFFVPSGAVPLFLLVFLISQVGFVAANVFYDGFLPIIASEDTIDQVSSRGYALGYIGGGLYVLLAFALILLADAGTVPIDTETATRIGIFGAGVWWVLFTIYALARLPEHGSASALPAAYAHQPKPVAYTLIGLRRTIATGRKLLGFKQILLFVIAFMFYNDGTQTVINISGAYAEDTLGLTIQEVIIAFLIVQFIAFGGAFGFGALAKRISPKRAILVNLVVWMGLAIGAFYLPEGEALPFYGLAAVVGFVLGGVQALSRSLYGTMIPEEASAEFYGFFSVFAKFSAIWGPLLFGLVANATGSGRPAILSILAFFVIGAVLLSRVDVDEARRSRSEWHFEGAEVS